MIASLKSWAKSLWVRFWLRRTKFSGRYGDLRKLYATRDPWDLLSEREQYRFDAVNAMVRAMAPSCRTLLELGCGEGFQTRKLMAVSAHVAGIDVSDLAIARAQLDLPQAEFHVGRAEDVGTIFVGRRFDIATACEVLYYSDDIDAAISGVQSVSDRLLVTNFAERAQHMRAHFSGADWQRLPDIVHHETIWECYFWHRGASRVADSG
jgi:predicted TPR repeat methyltransferase